jgi:hypothetical protein
MTTLSHTFMVCLWGNTNEAVAVCTVMNRVTPFSPQALKLPDNNWLVGFTGRLLSFEPNMEPGTGNSLCTKVSVDTISLLSEIIDSPQSKKPGDIYNVVDDEGAVVLKDCVHKYVDKPGNKPSVQLATDKMSLIGCSKGKHKVTLFLNGIGGGKAEQGEKKHK